MPIRTPLAWPNLKVEDTPCFGMAADPLDEGRHGFHFTEPVGQADRIDLARDDRQVFRCQEMAGLDGMEGGGTGDAWIEGHEHAIIPGGAHSGSPTTSIFNECGHRS